MDGETICECLWVFGYGTSSFDEWDEIDDNISDLAEQRLLQPRTIQIPISLLSGYEYTIALWYIPNSNDIVKSNLV